MTNTETCRLHSTTKASPVGVLTLVASDVGLRAVLWEHERPARVPLPVVGATDDHDHPVLRAAVVQLGEYFAGGRQRFDLPLDLDGTPFQQAAWLALERIPYGTTVSYGEQAAHLGDRRKARAVGAAIGRNPLSIVLPCHRVIGRDGALTGFAGGLDAKRALLSLEASQGCLTLPGDDARREQP